MVKTPSGNFEGRSPDYQVSLLVKSTSVKGNIGVAWQQPDGSIRIKLNSFIKIPESSEDLVITCWPNVPVPKKAPVTRPAKSNYDDDDIPF